MTVLYCGHCGESAADGSHDACARALAMEPPRYCAQCRRRMIVQVHPMGWSARCSQHGDLSSDQLPTAEQSLATEQRITPPEQRITAEQYEV